MTRVTNNSAKCFREHFGVSEVVWNPRLAHESVMNEHSINQEDGANRMRNSIPVSIAIAMLCLVSLNRGSAAADPINIWSDFAPGESLQSRGKREPPRLGETPPVTRVVGITQPTLEVFMPQQPNGAAVIILPGGGFVKVVPDKEGSEAAIWLNDLGITAFVLNYRTKNEEQQIGWKRPLQDAQRAMAMVRSRADEWALKRDKIGLLGFSAGGQVAARLLCDGGKLAYEERDVIDKCSHRPDFALLIYPWNIYDKNSNGLIDGMTVPLDCPPTFLVHTHDDNSSSLGAASFYIALKQNDIPSALHIFGNGGHGYGLRPVTGSQISTWPDHAATWLNSLKLAAGS
jgi:acetyl esterase/lipase